MQYHLPTILGGDNFIKEIKGKYLSGKEAGRDIPALRELKKVLIEGTIKEAEATFQGKRTLSRKAALYLCHRYSGRALKERGMRQLNGVYTQKFNSFSRAVNI